ncbi:unnamed protein product, partial [Arabidopsis halleri]
MESRFQKISNWKRLGSDRFVFGSVVMYKRKLQSKISNGHESRFNYSCSGGFTFRFNR